MKKNYILVSILSILAVFGLVTCESTAGRSGQNEYILVWEDDFTGDAIDTDKWSYQYGTGSQYGLENWGNNELEYYTDRPQNARISNGYLILEAREENYSNMNYTSARLTSAEKGDWRYARFEIRAKMPQGKGMWPALWLLPTDWAYGGWPDSGEIDIVEVIGHRPGIAHGTAHCRSGFSGSAFGNTFRLRNSATFADEFHVFALEWDKNYIRWYIDGMLYHEYKRDLTGYEQWPFNKRFHFMMNVAVGGYWPGSPDETTRFPQQMIVDYIRVYQKQKYID